MDNREWQRRKRLTALIESEIGGPMDLDAWTTSELKHMYDNLANPMYNGIIWNR